MSIKRGSNGAVRFFTQEESKQLYELHKAIEALYNRIGIKYVDLVIHGTCTPTPPEDNT